MAGETKLGWLAAECRQYGEQLFPDARIEPVATCADTEGARAGEGPDPYRVGLDGSIGPTTAEDLAARLHLSVEDVDGAMLRLEAQGHVLRGRFSAQASRSTNGAVGGAIVVSSRNPSSHHWSAAQGDRACHGGRFMRFPIPMAAGRTRHRVLHGEAGLLEVVKQLGGFEAAASAWEQILRVRMARYQPGGWTDSV